MEEMNEAKARQVILELVGEAEIYGVKWSSDGGRIQARVLVEGLPYLQTFELDRDQGKYFLAAEQPLGQQKL
jgi:hypothetical protein